MKQERRVRTLGSWLAARFPAVWKSQLPVAIGIGAVATAVMWVGGRMFPIAIASLPGLSTWLTWWSTTTIVFVAGAMLFLLQRVRVTRPVFGSTHLTRLVVCLAVAAFSLMVPSSALIRSLIPRIAAANPDADFDETIEFARQNQFWSCWDERSSLLATVHRDAARITRTLSLYHITTSFDVSEDQSCGRGYTVYSLVAQSGSDVPPTQVWLPVLEQRMLTLEAARAYDKGIGAFRTAFLTSVSEVAFVSVSFAVIAGLGMGGMTWRQRLTLRERSLSLRLGRVRWFARLDSWLAARSPTLWATQLHASLWEVATLAGAVAGMIYVIDRMGATWLFVVAAALLVAAPALMVRRQGYVRQTWVTTRDAAVFAIQLIVFLAVTLWPAYAFVRDDADFDGLLFAIGFYCLMTSLILKTARTLGPLIAIGSFWLALAWFVGTGTAVDALQVASDDFAGGLVMLVSLALLGGLTWLVSRSGRRPGFCAMLLGAFLIYTSTSAIGFALLLSGSSTASAEDFLISYSIGLATSIGVMRMTHRLGATVAAAIR